MKKNAIVIISIGDRQWLKNILKLAELYAEKCSADIIVERKLPDLAEFSLPLLPDSPGRPNKNAYACKTYFAWKMLEKSGYEKVLVLDDTCCISPNAPNLFEQSETGSVLYTTTGLADAEKSFVDIKNFIIKNNLSEIKYDTSLYMNSGVLLYDREMSDSIAPDKVIAAKDLLLSHFPHQTLTYFLLQMGKVKMKSVEKKFNSVPGVSLPKEVRRELGDILPYLKDDIYIHHVTGVYRKREIIINQICNKFLDKA